MRDSRIYLIHIRDCIARIKEYTSEGKQAFLEDLKTQDAVIRNLEVMSESVSQLPSQWTAAHPDIEWKKIKQLRNRLAHEYLSINLDIIWDIIERDIIELEETIEAIPTVGFAYAQEFWDL